MMDFALSVLDDGGRDYRVGLNVEAIQGRGGETITSPYVGTL
jgi:hypothetical protein